MKSFFSIFGSFFFFLIVACDKNDSLTDIPKNLEGQWILDNVVCFCYFGEVGNENFSDQQLWFSENLLYPIGPNNDIPNIAPLGKIHEFNLRGEVLILKQSGKKYTLEVNGNNLTLTFVDNEMIADDEIAFYFKKGPADPSCIDFSEVIDDGICTREYMPVCGCNDMTYSNACEVQNAGVMNWEDGVCDKFGEK
jgi:hypothetical protein